jgi:hypothetical protein
MEQMPPPPPRARARKDPAKARGQLTDQDNQEWLEPGHHMGHQGDDFSLMQYGSQALAAAPPLPD